MPIPEILYNVEELALGIRLSGVEELIWQHS